jgi:hypothetical protein
MATQTSREDTVGKAVEEQSTQGSVATVSSPSPPAPLEAQDVADVDGEEMESVYFCDM